MIFLLHASPHCTMLLSPCKIGNREFESDYHHRHHFLAIQLFQRKYLGYTLGAVSLSLHIFVGRVGLVHYTRSCYSFSFEDFDLLWLLLIWKQNVTDLNLITKQILKHDVNSLTISLFSFVVDIKHINVKSNKYQR